MICSSFIYSEKKEGRKEEKEGNGSHEMPHNICVWKYSLHNDKVPVGCFSEPVLLLACPPAKR